MKRKNEKELSEQTEVKLVDFVIPAKITAFCNRYEPQDHWTESCDVFTEAQLRTYFKAVVCPLGDPLALYLQELEMRGFNLCNDESGETVLYCHLK